MSFDDMDANALLMGGESVKSCSFKGDFPIAWEGVVLDDPKVVQQRDYDTDELLWWDDEETKPRLQVVIKLQTNVIDPMVDDDTGVRALWVKAESQKAVANAVRQAGARAVQPGGYLWIEFYDERVDPPVKGKKKERYPTKLYRARYTPPPSPGNRALMEASPEEIAAAKGQPTPAADIRAVAAQQSAVLAAMQNRGSGRPMQDVAPPF